MWSRKKKGEHMPTAHRTYAWAQTESAFTGNNHYNCGGYFMLTTLKTRFIENLTCKATIVIEQ